MSLPRPHQVAVWLPADHFYGGHSVEVEVARGKCEPMLTREGRDPQVILGNRTPAKAQLRLGFSIEAGCPGIRWKHGNFIRELRNPR